MNTKISYIKRNIEPVIRNKLGKGKIIIIYGPRQVGKTTLLKQLFRNNPSTLYLSCEEERVKTQLIPDSLALGRIIGDHQNIILDEAQHLENPGLVLKILIDNYSHRNFLASGSSSFDLANKLSEPLTGRHFRYHLLPVSLAEIKHNFPPTDTRFYLQESIIFGSYPETLRITNNEEKIEYLTLLTDAYLYKDILEFNLVKNSRKIRELLVVLALQLGNEVSYNELATKLAIDRKTVERYLDLLEKSFVIFRLSGFSRNLRSEIDRKIKIYFYDCGVRNALINNFNPLKLRNDAGNLFENYFIAEKVKQEVNRPQKANLYFWRTYDGKELDLVAEKNNCFTTYEIKLQQHKRKNRAFQAFKQEYPQSTLKQITLPRVLASLQLD